MKKTKRPSFKSQSRSSKKQSKVEDGHVMEALDTEEENDTQEEPQNRKSKAKEHKEQLERLKEKDPEFYEFLKEHDTKLLEFDDEDIDDDTQSHLSGDENIDGDIGDDDAKAVSEERGSKLTKQSPQESKKIITMEAVVLWINDIKEHRRIGAVKSMLRAFRAACHYGDDGGNGSDQGYRIASSSVFNKVMLFVLNEMDGIIRELLNFHKSGGKKDDVTGLTATAAWKKYGNLMRLYLGNALHVLNQMTDEQMASFTLKRIKSSNVFLAAFPTLLRKYIKVALHFWGTGGGALQVVSFLFVRDLCISLGSDCLDTCLKGIYKAHVSCCKIKGKHASISKLRHLRFLENCIAELYGTDLQNTYQHAFICIRQLATILRNAVSEKPKRKEDEKRKKEDKAKKKGTKEVGTKTTKEAYLKVYDWQFINCLELWTTIICTYSSDVDFQHLAYPLVQIILGVARLVPTARYLPIRMQCARMLNRIGSSTGKFIPVSMLLLDALELKDLTTAPSGGVGKAVDLFTRKLIGKPTLRTRAFEEACIHSVVEQLAEHLSQWSHSIAFFELSFIPLTRLRSFCKTTKVDKFRKEIKELILQVEANCEYTNAKRAGVDFSPSDPSATSFLKVEKESGSSPLSQFVSTLRLKAQQRSDSIVKSSVVVGEKSSVFGKIPPQSDEGGDSDDGAAVFNSSWLPNAKKSVVKSERQKPGKQRSSNLEVGVAMDEDVVEDLVLSSDDDEPASSISSENEKDDDDKDDEDGGDDEEDEDNKDDEGASKQASSGGKLGKRNRAPRKWQPHGKKQKTTKGGATRSRQRFGGSPR